MIKVHVWNFQGSKSAWGHASMHLGSKYISWWPGSARDYHLGTAKIPIYSVAHIHGQTFARDKELEGGPPDHTIELAGLDEKQVERWWKNFNQPGRDWSTLGQRSPVSE